jgi:hypothetical protein
MKWTSALVAVTFLFAGASTFACGDDDPPAPKCEKDDPTTDEDESECRALATVSSGEQAVNTRGCKACHGENMAGATAPLKGKPEYEKTFTGEKVELYPPNLTNDEETGVGSWSDDALAIAIRTGYDKDGLQLCPQMTHFSKMSDFEVYSIVLYLRSLPPVNQSIKRSICPPTKPE